jgi:hypothetical protein
MTLAFLDKALIPLQIVIVLVLGALAWRLIWAILVTPRLDRIPGRTPASVEEPSAEAPRVRVLVREPEPQIDVIEVITPAQALPSGSRNMVRRVSRS